MPMPTAPRFRVHTYRYSIRLPPLPTVWTFKPHVDWQVIVCPFAWGRDRGDWPAHWRTMPTFDGPIFWYWRCGPLTIRRFRVI